MYAIERAMAREWLGVEERLRRRQHDTWPIANELNAGLNLHKDLLSSDPMGKGVRDYLKHSERPLANHRR
jgi:hypothetical protein